MNSTKQNTTMKHLLRYTLFLLTALLPVLAMAQVDPKIQVNKYVTENADGTYTLDLETYATGYTKQTESYVATDFVLVLDRSGSMSNNKLRGNRVAKNTTLITSKTYQVVQDGRTYNLAYVNSSGGTSGTLRWRMCMNGTTPVSTFGETGDHTVTDSEEIYETQDVTRLDALKTAVSDFVQLVYDNNPTTGTLKHAVSIVWYGGDASGTGSVSDYAGHVTDGTTDFTSIAYNFVELKSPTIATTIKNSVTAVTTSSPNVGSGTFCNYGLQVAYNTLLAAKDDKRNKVTVFFTDGEPGAYAGYFHEGTARDACKYAVDLKSSALENTAEGESFSSDGITHNKKTFAPVVYSIGIMDSNTAFYHASSSYSNQGSSKAGDKYRFMHYVSSNYNLTKADFPDTYTFASDVSSAECQGEGKAASHHGSEDPHGYFMRSDGSDLSRVFAKIATKEIKDRNEALGASTVIKDAMTDDFKLPDGATAADIKLYTCAAKADNTTADTVWSATGTAVTGAVTVYKNAANKKVPSSVTGGHTEYWVPLTTVTPTISGKQVEVTGYDFKDKFVGAVHDFTDATNNIIGWTGEKFIMEFVIERDPASSGAKNQMNTNTANSGVYLSGTATDPLLKYPVPKVPVPNIIITKKGLAKGESAVFEVERVTSSAGTTPDATNVFKNTFILTKTNDAIDPSIEFVASGPGFYKVTEKTWTWNDNVTYDSGTDGDPDTDGTSYVQELTNTDTKKTFTFGVKTGPSKTTIKPKHNAEANINNGKES